MPMIKPNEFETRAVRGMTRFFLWALAWVGTMILVDKAILYGWYTSPYVSAVGIVINAALGVGVIRAFLLYLRDMDELQRRIQMESLGIAMGVGFVGSFSYSLLVTTGFVTDPEISDIILLMGLAYMASVVVGQFRYR